MASYLQNIVMSSERFVLKRLLKENQEMSNVLVIQHVQSEGLGLIAPLLRSRGLGHHIVRVDKGGRVPTSIAGYSALIVLGGPMGVYEGDVYPFINAELRLIKKAIKERRPVLGVCLGAQLLAKAAGAEVYKGEAKEIGWFNVSLTDQGRGDKLLLGLPDTFIVFQWHGDTFTTPPRAENLAGSDLFERQLIRVGANAYGIQFHLEVTEQMIKEWLAINAKEAALVKGVDPDRIVKEAVEHIERLHRNCRAMLTRFLRQIGR
ncbi:MAG: gamma-glutamyl-gamma-aminobutyrate hydrolase family protein [Deltaproteobacteria bacterium]|nr:gamma-glutamyl-gamma-aminobutyrate hydrolase family protein [Deltaproteobacteria bacterium]